MLLALLLSSSPYSVAVPRGCRDRSCVRGRVVSNSASLLPTYDFELAPLGGAGMPAAACDGTDPIAYVKGVAFTVTTVRDGGAGCMKGNTLTEIQPGDYVTVAANHPRIMPGGNDGGTWLGIMREVSTLNQAPSPEDFSVTWTREPVGLAVAANACAAPDGTTHGSVVALTATTVNQQSIVYKSVTMSGLNSFSVFVRLVGADGGTIGSDGGMQTTDLCRDENAVTYCSPCTFTATGFARCNWQGADAGVSAVYIGNNSFANGHVARAAANVCLWGADLENLETITTYEKTQRLQEDVWVDTLMPSGTNLTLSGYVELPYTYSGGRRLMTTWSRPTASPASKQHEALTSTPNADCIFHDRYTDNHVDRLSSASFTPLALNQFQCAYAYQGTINACANASCSASSDGGILALEEAGRIYVGGPAGSGVEPNGVLKGLSITSPARKQIYLFGDSIVLGGTSRVGVYGQPEFYFQNVVGTGSGINNQGGGGYTIYQCANQWNQELNLIKDAGTQSTSTMMVQCGINSRSGPPDGGDPAGETFLQLAAMLKAAQDAGVAVLGSTITPYCLNDNSVAYVDSVNAQLRAWGPTQNILIAETFRALEGPPDSGCLASQYEQEAGEKLHPNDAGTAVMTQVWISTGGW